MKPMKIAIALVANLPAWAAFGASAGDAARGERLYESRCIACHSLDANRIGPMHRGVFGRTAGSVAGYRYSKALADSQVVWDERSLNDWLRNPQAFIPGQKMGFRVSVDSDRADIVAYLKQASN